MTTAIPSPQDLHAAPARPSVVSARRAAIGAALIAVAIGAGLVARHWWTAGRFIESTDDAYVGGEVTVISARVPGYIAQVSVTDNQAVHAGDLLLRLDDRDYRAALAKAEAAVVAARAQLTNLDATTNLQHAVIAQANADVAAAAAETSRAKEDDTRYANLVRKSVVSAQSAERAVANYRQALAADQRAQAGVVAAQRELTVITSRHEQAAAALAQAIADRDIAKLNLGYTELRAPIDGTVGNRRAHNGAYAAAGSQMLAIVPANGLWVDANFKESQLAKFRPGLPATVIVDASGRRLRGHIASVAPATGAQFSVLPPENATGNFTKIVQRVPVRIALDDADGVLGALRPGLSVVAEIDSRGDDAH